MLSPKGEKKTKLQLRKTPRRHLSIRRARALCPFFVLFAHLVKLWLSGLRVSRAVADSPVRAIEMLRRNRVSSIRVDGFPFARNHVDFSAPEWLYTAPECALLQSASAKNSDARLTTPDQLMRKCSVVSGVTYELKRVRKNAATSYKINLDWLNDSF